MSLRDYLASYHAANVPALLAAGHRKAAIENARKAVSLQPGAAEYHSLLALALEQRAAYLPKPWEFLEEARREMGLALKLNPRHGDYWLHKARILERIANLRQIPAGKQMAAETAAVEACFQGALRLDPHNIYYLLSAAAYYARAGEVKRAEDFFVRAWELSPQNLSQHYLSMEERQGALDDVVAGYLSRQLAKDAGNAPLISWLGGIYEARGDYPLARQVYERGLQTPKAAGFKRLIQRVDSKLRRR